MTADEFMSEVSEKHKVWYDRKRDCLVSNIAFVIYAILKREFSWAYDGND